MKHLSYPHTPALPPTHIFAWKRDGKESLIYDTKKCKTAKEHKFPISMKNHMCEENPIKMLHENSILYYVIYATLP